MSGSGEGWSRRIRGIHRWTSVLFTVVVAFVTLVSVRGEEVAEWIYYLPLPFLAVLLLTGLYLFALPYLAKRRGRASRTAFSSDTGT